MEVGDLYQLRTRAEGMRQRREAYIIATVIILGLFLIVLALASSS